MPLGRAPGASSTSGVSLRSIHAGRLTLKQTLDGGIQIMHVAVLSVSVFGDVCSKPRVLGSRQIQMRAVSKAVSTSERGHDHQKRHTLCPPQNNNVSDRVDNHGTGDGGWTCFQTKPPHRSFSASNLANRPRRSPCSAVQHSCRIRNPLAPASLILGLPSRPIWGASVDIYLFWTAICLTIGVVP